MQTVSHVLTPVKAAPKNGGWDGAFVTIRPDGPVYRWYRHTGRQGYTSSEAFLTPAAATQAAQSIARCYGVQFRQGGA